MTNPTLDDVKLSPLDQIRLAEADVTRKIAIAREERERTLAYASEEAKKLLDEAQESGKRKGITRYREIIDEAEEKAQAILAGSEHQAEELRRKGSWSMDIAVRRVIHIITGMEEGARER